MICPHDGHDCNKQVAFSIIEIINGEKRELNTCFDCPFKQTKFAEIMSMIPVNFQIQEPHKYAECKCGMTFYQLVKGGRLGCPECYKTFAEFISPSIEKCHKATKHIGKIPSKFRKNNEVLYLEKEMIQAIKDENYERCSQIRDRLKEIKNG